MAKVDYSDFRKYDNVKSVNRNMEFNVKVAGHLTFRRNLVSLIAEENVNGIKRGSMLKRVSVETFYKMQRPLKVNVRRNWLNNSDNISVVIGNDTKELVD